MKRGTENLLKFKLLCKLLDLPLWQAKGILQSVWDFTGQSAPRGDIGRFPNAHIAIGLEYSGDADELIGALAESGWLDKSDEYRLVVHGWSDHCERSIHTHVARYGWCFVDGVEPDDSQLNKEAKGLALKRKSAASAQRSCKQVQHSSAEVPHSAANRASTEALTESLASTSTNAEPLAETEEGARTDTEIETGIAKALEGLGKRFGDLVTDKILPAVIEVTGDKGAWADWWLAVIEVLDSDARAHLHDLLRQYHASKEPNNPKGIATPKQPGRWLSGEILRYARENGIAKSIPAMPKGGSHGP